MTSVCRASCLRAMVLAYVVLPAAAFGQTTTRDITFTSHDGHAMTGRLTLPDTPGAHPILVFVQNAEGSTLDQRTRNAAGNPVAFFDLYRETLAPMNIGFFSYEGRGAHTDPTQRGGILIDPPVYNTSTIENKVQDAISAVRLLQKQPGVDASQIFLRGVSEGTLLAAETASRIPREVKGIVLSGVIGTTLKESLKHQLTSGRMMQFLGEFDANADGRISPQEFEADPKGFRKNLGTTTFGQIDATKDGFITADDIRMLTKPLTDAFEAGNVEITEAFLKAAAAVPIPTGWVKDHFTHAAMWTFISPLTMPVGIFQGEADRNTGPEDLRVLEAQVKAAGKTNVEFRYFEGLGHGLGSTDYFQRGAHSAGYVAIFDFIKRHTEKK